MAIDDECFRDFQDKVESRCGVKPLNRREIIEKKKKEDKEDFDKKYKNPRNDLKKKLLRTINNKEESRGWVDMDVGQMADDVNSVPTEASMYSKDIPNSLSYTADYILKFFNVGRNMQNPKKYNDFYFMMDFFNKVSDRLS